MSLLARCSKNFSASSRSKGVRYYEAGYVTILATQGESLDAIVKGSSNRVYRINLDWTQPSQGIEASCSCPHYDEGSFCKHIWATINEAEERELIGKVPGRGSLSLRFDDEDGYDEVDLEEDWHELDEGAETQARLKAMGITRLPSGQNGQVVKAGRAGQQSTSWLNELGVQSRIVRGGSVTSPFEQLVERKRQVFFVLDVMATIQANALVVMLKQQESRQDGQWGKIKQLRVKKQELERFTRADAEVLSLLLGNYSADPAKWESYYSPHDVDQEAISQVEITPAAHATLLPKLCEGGHFGWMLSNEQAAEEMKTLRWDDGPTWKPRLRLEEDDSKKQWTILGELYRESEEGLLEVMSLAQPVLLLHSGLVLLDDRLALFQNDVDFRWVALLRKHAILEVPYADRSRLLQELHSGLQPMDVVWPDNLQPEIATVQPIGHLKIHPKEDSTVPSWQRKSYQKQRNLYADASFEYGGQIVEGGSECQAIIDPQTEQVLLRDSQAEMKLLSQLAELNLAPKSDSYYLQGTPGSLEFPSGQLSEVVSHLVREGWQVEAEGHKVRAAGSFSLNVTSGIDWFDVESDIDFGDASASLPSLLAAVKKNEKYVLLDDGTHGLLPEEWLKKLAPLAEFATVEGDNLRFKPSQALLLDALLDDRQEEISLEVDKQFATFRKKLRSFSGVSPAKAPRGFHGTLRKYQQEGLGWMKFLQEFRLGGCLADDMGLGKTVQVLALLLTRRQRRLPQGEERKPSLVVAPKSVVFNWELEAKKFTPTLSVLNYTGLERKEWTDRLHEFNVVLTTYGTLRRDIEFFQEIKFDYAILDESQAIKNDKSLTAKASRLLHAEHRLTLTGTPVENHLGELWSQLEYLNPGMLGRSTAFRRFSKSFSGDEDANEEKTTEALESFRRGLAPFILRRTKDKVLTDLPEKNEQTLYCDLLPHDRKKYNELRDYYRDSLLKRIDTSGMNKSKMHVLEALLRLRQTACHPGLVDKKLVNKPSAKVDVLVEQLTEVAEDGHKALVFSQFTSLLSIVRKRLDKKGIRYEYLDGRTRNRQKKVENFQGDSDIPVFLISLKAGGTGLNLTAADYVFLLDPWWNPAVEAQAIDRAHRIGQTRRVFAYRLIARNTVEEKIIDMQKKKRKLADAIVSGSGAVMSGLTVDDLQALLS